MTGKGQNMLSLIKILKKMNAAGRLVKSKHFFDDNIMKCLPSYVYPRQRKYCIFSFHRKMSDRGCFVLVMKWFSLSQIFCYSDEHLKRKDIFNPLSLTKSKDGASERHDELSVLEHLGLGLELHGPHHQDDHAGHEEGHAEVEQGQSPAETFIAVTENRWMNGLDECLLFCQRINYSRR